MVERSDGNPLFVEELADALAADGAPMPPHLRDAVISRVERMPDDAAAVLRPAQVGDARSSTTCCPRWCHRRAQAPPAGRGSTRT